MTPYSPQALEMIRTAVKGYTPPETVRRALGWDASMFQKICRRHGIDLHAPARELVDSPTDAAVDAPEPPKRAAKRKLGRSPRTVELALAVDVVRRLNRYADAGNLALTAAGAQLVAEYLRLHDLAKLRPQRVNHGLGETRARVVIAVDAVDADRIVAELGRRFARRPSGSDASLPRLVAAMIAAMLR